MKRYRMQRIIYGLWWGVFAALLLLALDMEGWCAGAVGWLGFVSGVIWLEG